MHACLTLSHCLRHTMHDVLASDVIFAREIGAMPVHYSYHRSSMSACPSHAKQRYTAERGDPSMRMLTRSA